MKKTIIFVFASLAAIASADNVKLPDFPNDAPVYGIDIPRASKQRITFGTTEAVKESAEIAEVKASTIAPRIQRAGEINKPAIQVGYRNPKGTLFLGMDENGKGIWFATGGIVGGWSDSIHHWTFEQTVSGAYDSIMYTNKALKKYGSAFEDTKYFYKDANNNWCDSIVSAGGFQKAYAMDINGDNTQYPWPKDMPLQTVYRKDTTETFMLLTKTAKPTVNDAGFIVGGLPSGNSADGLWPLTNAVNINREGISIELMGPDDKWGNYHYIYGTDSLTKDSLRTAPKKMITTYERPQAPLYVKSISVMLSTKDNNKIKNYIKINNLRVNVIGKDGELIATSTANETNLSTMAYASVSSGRLLTFSFRKSSEYGELMEEGFLVSDSFNIEITDIDPTDEFGIYCAKSTVNASRSYIEYEDSTIAQSDYDPYIMLNGIYNTLENYVLTESVSKFVDAENDGDTIPINMVSVNSPYYKYRGYYAAEDLQEGYTFEYYSTFMPYDSVSRYWLMDIRKPEYIELGCDFDTNLGTEDDPITAWSYIRVFDMYIYATSTPRIGDIISVGKCGRQTVFRIREIDGATAIGEISEQMRKNNVQKVLSADGMVRILRNNQQYNIIGQLIY